MPAAEDDEDIYGSFDHWKMVHRWVKSGSRGIALLTDEGGIRYVFDVSDTGGSSGRTLPLQWTSMEQVQYKDGSIEEGIYESQIIGA